MDGDERDPVVSGASQALRVIEAVGSQVGEGRMPCQCGGLIRWRRNGPRAFRAACDRCDFRMLS